MCPVRMDQIFFFLQYFLDQLLVICAKLIYTFTILPIKVIVTDRTRTQLWQRKCISSGWLSPTCYLSSRSSRRCLSQSWLFSPWTVFHSSHMFEVLHYLFLLDCCCRSLINPWTCILSCGRMLFHAAQIVVREKCLFRLWSFWARNGNSSWLVYSNLRCWWFFHHRGLNCISVHGCICLLLLFRRIIWYAYATLYLLSRYSTTIDTVWCCVVWGGVCSCCWTLQLSRPSQATSYSWRTSTYPWCTTTDPWFLLLILHRSSCPWLLEGSNLERFDFNLRHFIQCFVLQIIVNFSKPGHRITRAVIISTPRVLMSCILLSIGQARSLLSTKLHLLRLFGTFQCTWLLMRTETSRLYLVLTATFCFSHFWYSSWQVILSWRCLL